MTEPATGRPSQAARPPRWTYCACQGPGPEAVAYLFIAAHLAGDRDQAARLAELVDDTRLPDLELILRRATAETRDRLERHHPDFGGDYDVGDVWFVMDQMTDYYLRDQHITAHLERIHAGLPPQGLTHRNEWLELLQTEASLITAYYYAVTDDITTAEQHLTSEAHRIIQQQPAAELP